MLHKMHLYEQPFELIRSGQKTVELRLNDEKRRAVRAGDFIEFSLLNGYERLTVRVVRLHHFSSFAELYSSLPKDMLGYSPDELPDPKGIEKFYSIEMQEKYGVLGIEFRLTDLQKFVDAQEFGYSFGETYQTALSEIKHGEKLTHWIWYVFPQIRGIGLFGTTAYFSIADLEEAIDYCEHPVLGARLVEISQALLNLDTDDPVAVFGTQDAFKLRSCMTLFCHAAPEQTVFREVLERFCLGNEDDDTLNILGV